MDLAPPGTPIYANIKKGNSDLKFKMNNKTASILTEPISSTWIFTIENFSKYNEIGRALKSFQFGLTSDDIWHLMIYPHGQKSNNGEHVSLYLYCEKVKYFIVPRLTYKFSIISTNCENYFERQGCHPGWVIKGIGSPKFIERAQLFARKDLFLPNDTLTISCKVTRISDRFASKMIDVPISQHVENLQSLADQNNFGEIITLRICNKEPTGVNHHESTTMQSPTSTRSSAELSPEKKKLKTDDDDINEEFNENTLVVRESKDFKIYKGILTSQSPVFKAMFEHKETKENQENLIEIEDMDPEVGSDMLHFLRTDKLCASENNLMKLLIAADKYQLWRLKALCERALFKILSIDNSLTTLSESIMYNAHQLKRATTAFIVHHISEIKKSEEYELFKETDPGLIIDIYEAIHDKKNTQ